MVGWMVSHRDIIADRGESAWRCGQVCFLVSFLWYTYVVQDVPAYSRSTVLHPERCRGTGMNRWEFFPSPTWLKGLTNLRYRGLDAFGPARFSSAICVHRRSLGVQRGGGRALTAFLGGVCCLLHAQGDCPLSRAMLTASSVAAIDLIVVNVREPTPLGGGRAQRVWDDGVVILTMGIILETLNPSFDGMESRFSVFLVPCSMFQGLCRGCG